MNVRELMPPNDHQDEALAAIRQQCQAGSLAPQSTQRLTKDGRTLQVSLIVSPLMDDGGKIYAMATTERVVQS
jgi:two-component system CheB/CheR fusion protein